MQTDCRKPIPQNTRFTITSKGRQTLDAIEKATPAETCPRCGGCVGAMQAYQGGAGYQPWLYCKNADCDYWKRSP